MFEIYVYKFDDCWWFDDKVKNIMGEELVKNSIMFRGLTSNKVVKDEPYHIGVRFYFDKKLI